MMVYCLFTGNADKLWYEMSAVMVEEEEEQEEVPASSELPRRRTTEREQRATPTPKDHASLAVYQAWSPSARPYSTQRRGRGR